MMGDMTTTRQKTIDGFAHSPDLQQAWVEWVRDIGADPNNIPWDATFAVDDDAHTVTFPVYVRDDRGLRIDDTGQAAARQPCTVHLDRDVPPFPAIPAAHW
jgi:hypothetical protein